MLDSAAREKIYDLLLGEGVWPTRASSIADRLVDVLKGA